ncbi:MAG TPA: aldehyde dehydrogenase family protein [Actinomycetes bacterium]|jgi:1-pyrroline-5-carboxylate dehydrogenase|nr:aldehyde dehydrogenase family protein [Actinomycetes bacterium]
MASFRVTYATLSADNEELHAAYEEGVRTARSWLGQTFPVYVSGEARSDGRTFDLGSPNDSSIKLGTFHEATRRDVDDAVAAARAAAPAWAGMPWRERVAVLRRGADLISERSNELAALMSIEVGKNRLEALGDVEEAADLIRYYCDQVEANDGFDRPMGRLSANEHTRSVLKPHGVWAIISPFNFPMALAAGPSGAALVAGNTVVFKPSPQGSFTGAKLYECLRDAGLPAGVFNYLSGGDQVGAAVVRHPGVDGITFTGSYAVGMDVYKHFATRYPKPTVIEMGGKNPAIVSARADLDLAAEGVTRSAFGFSGQKCSACSRVYVERPVLEEFQGRLAERAREVVVGDPVERPVYMGPVIDQEAVERYRQAVEEAAKEGRVLAGGELRGGSGGIPDGNYVAPTVVADLPVDHRLFKDELFVPLVAVAGVDSLDQGLTLANRTNYGLTAGLYSADEDEIQRFLDGIQAGVVYVNRRAGATTGAWPGVQPFGGWKGSGSSGRASGGLYYVQQFLREQSQTVIT